MSQKKNMSWFHKVPYTAPSLKCVETFGCTTIPESKSIAIIVILHTSSLTMELWLIMAFLPFLFFCLQMHFQIYSSQILFQYCMFNWLLTVCPDDIWLKHCIFHLFQYDIMIMLKVFTWLKIAIEHLPTALNIYLSYSFKYVEIQQMFGGKIANRKFLISP